ncbi:glycine cleavage system protein H [Candidatus Contubernalis alkaliaceticus]|uniref:hypothetical protein n=1 Tax=Candidatus Contubernalis alkaliaceticus TaxID=338645 RepID=UPI001F4C182B|nr:hypothetical protein [Candidatus Contubernalis alkalaceticus]UNC91586.1 hypothetical protein HUE98_05480 [Candidatus Contubernalis alkalaceticus]
MESFQFMAKPVQMDENLRYYIPFDYWVKLEEERDLITLGLTPTGNIKEGEYRSVEFALKEGDEITCGEVIAVAITGKIKYLDSMVEGRVVAVNRDLEKDIDTLKDFFKDGWLLSINILNAKEVYEDMVTLSEYKEILKKFEAGAVPPGTKGGTSPTCRSVYQSIKEQKEK